MFGPLPPLHKWVLVLAAVLVCMGIGFWVGAVPEIPLNIRVGLVAGAGAGIAAAFVLVHDFHRRQRPAVRVRRHEP
ncbi:unannotated protein [freshwater metagenome]|jgi:hypothetical protein|uniref:Unannotated protein n=1 Tax=freshwater metagenome TaxID=449393 RepID=A0A6J7KXK2_9ZZZZ|nr:OapA N-terminal domain-containing protein [Nocardioides lacusdianchii]MSW71516.1 hypothetical protein [Actinomycetota bacterium]